VGNDELHRAGLHKFLDKVLIKLAHAVIALRCSLLVPRLWLAERKPEWRAIKSVHPERGRRRLLRFRANIGSAFTIRSEKQ
jgi:hypothetical protein